MKIEETSRKRSSGSSSSNLNVEKEERHIYYHEILSVDKFVEVIVRLIIVLLWLISELYVVVYTYLFTTASV